MTQEPAIIGFRQDRVGARITGIVSLMRLAHAFGATTRFAWLAQPDGPWPELSDPTAFFTPDFVASHIVVVDRAPPLDGRRSLHAESAHLNRANFARALANGVRFHSDAAFAVATFQGEPAAQVEAEVRAVAAQLQLAAPLARALDRMDAAIRAIGGGPASAIHVRRGDILDSFPWSYSAWPGKFVPDEFLRAFAEGQDGAVIAFSDTPAAVLHLAQGNGRIIPVDRLLAEHAPDVAPDSAARDVLELMLMARCATVGAPSQSAFSQAANVIGGVRIVPLPAGLPRGVAIASHDALLDRLIAAPGSFFAPGDMAQSVAYAAPHARSVGRVPELIAAFADRPGIMARFPFVPRHLAAAAEAAGLGEAAVHLARLALGQKLLRARDRVYCDSIVLLADARRRAAGDAGAMPEPTLHARFVEQALEGRSNDGQAAKATASLILSRPGVASDQLMFPPRLHQILARHADGSDGQMPLHAFLCDWDELVQDDSTRASLRRWPVLDLKLGPALKPLTVFEQAVAAGVAMPQPDEDVAILLGFAASVLTLHGRLRRSFAVLEWLDRVRPGQAITAKRLANAYFQNGNTGAAWKHMDRAIAAAPDNALLHLSAAVRAQDDAERRLAHLTAAAANWPELARPARALARLRNATAKARKAAGAATGKATAKAAAKAGGRAGGAA